MMKTPLKTASQPREKFFLFFFFLFGFLVCVLNNTNSVSRFN